MRQEGKCLKVARLVETHPIACEECAIDKPLDTFEADAITDVHCLHFLSNHVAQFFNCLQLTALVSLKTDHFLADDGLRDADPRSLCGRHDE